VNTAAAVSSEPKTLAPVIDVAGGSTSVSFLHPDNENHVRINPEYTKQEHLTTFLGIDIFNFLFEMLIQNI
jgi:hypothetical protein